jgi:hypothetical protein
MPVILATQEAEMRRAKKITRSDLEKIQKRAGGVAQGVGPEFKPQHFKKKKSAQAPLYAGYPGRVRTYSLHHRQHLVL